MTSTDEAWMRDLRIEIASAAQRISPTLLARRRRKRITTLAVSVALLASASALGASGILDPAHTLLSRDLAHVAANSKGTFTPPPIAGTATVHAFTQARDGFTIDVIRSRDNSVCMVLLNAKAQLGTDHASTCGNLKDIGNRPLMIVFGGGQDGEAAGVAPANATSVKVRFANHLLDGTLRNGYWAVRLPASITPTDHIKALRAIGRITANFS